MSYFDDQQEAWFESDCKGRIEDYDPYDADSWPEKSQKPRKRTAGYGSSRNLLAANKLEEFAAWAIADGFKREPTKGNYEVLRLRWERNAPLLFFRRAATVAGAQPQHLTCQGEASQLVRRWLASKKETKKP